MNDPKMILSSLVACCLLDVPSRFGRDWRGVNGQLLWGTILFFLTVFTIGCEIPQNPAQTQNYYYLNPNKKLSSIGRVVIVELNNESSYTQISTDVTETLFQSLQKKQVFGLTVVRKNDPSWRSLRLEKDSTLDLNQILTIQETLKCDGLLLGTITEFRPYPHMAIGLRLKLLDLQDGELIWALEQVWDSSDKTTEKRIKDYFKSRKGSGLTPLHEQLAIVSPLEFIKFVSYEVSETL
ncbi:hypothetical protein ACFL5Z_01480 [Planctomycetota bacterium]